MRIILLSGTWDRAHFALMLAAAAAAIGRPVTIFASGAGLAALHRDWTALSGSEADNAIRATGVAGFDELRDACLELDVRFLACESALRAANLTPDHLIERTTIAGLPTLLGLPGEIVTV